MSRAKQPAERPLWDAFQAPTRTWFQEAFAEATPAQRGAWPPVTAGESTLLVAPTGSGKTLAAFLAAIDRVLFSEPEDPRQRCRVLYLSPIKALAYDVERNLRGPLSGIARTAERMGLTHREVEIAMRTGDTPSHERARFRRRGADILITTPESLYLLLTSQSREMLRGVETVIVDEIHAVAGTKRGTHLSLSLERLQAELGDKPLQRIGLSATQKPLDGIARWLGGMDARAESPRARPVTIVDAHAPRQIDLSIEVPVEDMTQLVDTERPLAPLERDDGSPPAPRSLWSSIHPRLLELVRAHRSTMVFVNNRRLAERLAASLNELADAPVARAHHGSVAREERAEIEDALKRGELPCIIATSSLELGLDIGAIELVVQIEAPPSVSSGIQRVGRANHQVGKRPKGAFFPKHRGDLLACAEAVRRMLQGGVEVTSPPENALDVLAQQVVAIVASEQATDVPSVLSLVRGSTAYEGLTRPAFEGVLDMLSGRYPSDEFAELKPRLTWDRDSDQLLARRGALRLAVANAGVIPDRGLYGVFLADAEQKSRRVGELDEEMVFEAREGEVFVLGASSWRIEEITHDRVLVQPAPGQPGKMPFWRGDGLGRSAELGLGIGGLLRYLESTDDASAVKRLTSEEYRLGESAAHNLVRYVRDQAEAPNLPPTDRRVVIETFIDEVGDYRVCLLCPLGRRVLTPLALCIVEKAAEELGVRVEAVHMDDGLVMRFPEQDEPPDVASLFPTAAEVDALLMQTLSDTPLFASHFRECAGRALLLPRRHPQRRAPLWATRKRAAQLLSVATRFPSFPIVLETFRECLKDVFDVPALKQLCEDVARGKVALASVRSERPSPFASTLLFNYVGNFMYDSDAPLAERRAAALSIDVSQLRELLGQAEMRELLDDESIASVARDIARLAYPPRDADELHDLLLLVGDLTPEELDERLGTTRAATLTSELEQARRACSVRIAGEARWIACEDAARYRDAVGAMPPSGLPSAFLQPVAAPLADLISRYARTHVPFSLAELRARYPASDTALREVLDARIRSGRMLSGELHPAKPGVTYCDAEVMRAIKRRSLARLRKDIEPVDALGYARFLLAHHGVARPRRSRDALRDVMEQLQGLSLSLEDLEQRILPARLTGFAQGDLDELMASGELTWRGMREGADGGRVALYFREDFALLAPPPEQAEGTHVQAVRELLAARGAMFFHELVSAVGGFAPDVLDALWELVWAGEVTNDTLLPLRSRLQKPAPRSSRRGTGGRGPLPGSQGRWTRLEVPGGNETERRAALVGGLLARHGVLVRDALKHEGVAGGFSAAYEVLKTMEDVGRVRRGYFVEGLGAAQFAAPGTDERLRAQREPDDDAAAHAGIGAGKRARLLAATDPASPWGASLPWPGDGAQRPMRAAGTCVVLDWDASLLAWVGRNERSLTTFFDPEERAGQQRAGRLVEALVQSALARGLKAVLLASVDGGSADRSPLAQALQDAGFVATSRGMLYRKPRETALADPR